MGGYGSGAPRRWASIEATQSIILDVNRLRRRSVIQADARTLAAWRSPDGDPLDPTIAASTWRGSGELRLRGWATTWEHGRFEVEQTIELTSTVPMFGGWRFWFVCPRSGRRCARLYLPNGGRQFASRQAYRLVHRSRQECPADRLSRRARKLRAKLGGEASNVAAYPEKPKRMRWRTYEAAMDRIQAWEAEADAAALGAFMSRAARWMGRTLE